ncbi:MAG: 16S rRNA (adenine(1518)-N(6)/adenine(1519)-N(6))-dimethyltransferase RsmA [Proteobacteria bacterium]|nr:16S rRNA (adenine(1518)-N(6)/adenine(1519)-N(6))-dimethyltransferase RsmA [Pseudomonadota bacterium]
MALDHGRIRQKKSLSQVFLRTDWPVRKLIERLNQLHVTRILEIGPGGGILTRALLESPWKVTAIEKDDRFAEKLVDYFSQKKEELVGSIEIVNQDVLKFDLKAWLDQSEEPTAIVGNIPYGISTPIVMWVLPFLERVKGVEFLVQLEFASRLAGIAGTKDYGSLSVYTQLRAQVTIECKVERTCFTPIPAVDSALVFLKAKADVLPEDFLRKVETVARVSFTQRRKKLRNAIRQFLTEDALASCPIDVNRRPDTLRPEEYVELAKFIYSAKSR